MKPIWKTIQIPIRQIGFDTVIFYLLFFIYVWLAVDPRLIFHSIGIFMPLEPFTYSTGWAFFEEHLSRPGGLAEYVARWLTLFFSLGWAGALIISTTACLMSFAVDGLTQIAGKQRGVLVRYVPALMLLVVWASYNHPIRPVLSALTALVCFFLYSLSSLTRAKVVLVLFFSSAIVYALAGVDGLLLYLVLIGCYEIVIKQCWAVCMATLLAGLFVPWGMGKAGFGSEAWNLFDGFLDETSGISPLWRPYVVALFCMFPATLLVNVLVKRLLSRKQDHQPRRRKASREAKRSAMERVLAWFQKNDRWQTIQFAAMVLVAVIVGWRSLDVAAKNVLRMDYCKQQGMWDEVLQIARSLPQEQYNIHSARNTQIALYHAGTGRLAEEMFCYPQFSEVSLFRIPNSNQSAYTYFQESQVYLELGQVNLAEKCACEAFEFMPDSPALLEQLAVINVVKGRPETAKMFLRALCKKPFHYGKATAMLQGICEDPSQADDPRIQRIRDSMPETNYAGNQTVEEMLVALLDQNPSNRMAFELLLVYYLHTARPDKVVELLKRPEALKYDRLPRHAQEAIVVHSMLTEGRIPEPNAQLDRAVIDQAVQFVQILNYHGRNQHHAQAAAVSAGLGSTFYFYFNFGMSGL